MATLIFHQSGITPGSWVTFGYGDLGDAAPGDLTVHVTIEGGGGRAPRGPASDTPLLVAEGAEVDPATGRGGVLLPVWSGPATIVARLMNGNKELATAKYEYAPAD